MAASLGKEKIDLSSIDVSKQRKRPPRGDSRGSWTQFGLFVRRAAIFSGRRLATAERSWMARRSFFAGPVKVGCGSNQSWGDWTGAGS